MEADEKDVPTVATLHSPTPAGEQLRPYRSPNQPISGETSVYTIMNDELSKPYWRWSIPSPFWIGVPTAKKE